MTDRSEVTAQPLTDTFNPVPPQPPAPKPTWSTKKKVAAGVGGGFVTLWAMGTVSQAVGPDTITETVITTVTETPAAVTVTETSAPVTETVTITEDAPAPPVVSDPEPAPAAVSPAPKPAPKSTYYPNCAAAKAAGAAPLHRGDPGYSSKLDRDGDGVACER